jgi:hypothetical protein
VGGHSRQQAVRRVKAGLVIDSAFCLALALLTWSVLPIAVTCSSSRQVHKRAGPAVTASIPRQLQVW